MSLNIHIHDGFFITINITCKGNRQIPLTSLGSSLKRNRRTGSHISQSSTFIRNNSHTLIGSRLQIYRTSTTQRDRPRVILIVFNITSSMRNNPCFSRNTIRPIIDIVRAIIRMGLTISLNICSRSIHAIQCCRRRNINNSIRDIANVIALACHNLEC